MLLGYIMNIAFCFQLLTDMTKLLHNNEQRHRVNNEHHLPFQLLADMTKLLLNNEKCHMVT